VLQALELALPAVKQLPYWARNNGSDHFWVVSSDFGRCDLRTIRDQLQDSFVIHHFGKVQNIMPTTCK
jgi:hypothetical protein